MSFFWTSRTWEVQKPELNNSAITATLGKFGCQALGFHVMKPHQIIKIKSMTQCMVMLSKFCVFVFL